jgi:hypothetical protein
MNDGGPGKHPSPPPSPPRGEGNAVETSAKPRGNLRGAVLWSAGILLALGLVWFVAAVVVPFFQFKGRLHKYAWTYSRMPQDFVNECGDEKRTRAQLLFAIRLPGWALKDEDRTAAAEVLGHLVEWEEACKLYRTTPHAAVRSGLGLRVFSPVCDDPAKYRGLTMDEAIKLFGEPFWVRRGVGVYGGEIFLEFNEEGKLKNAFWLKDHG